MVKLLVKRNYESIGLIIQIHDVRIGNLKAFLTTYLREWQI